MTYLGSDRWQFNNGLIFEKWQIDEMIEELRDKGLIVDFVYHLPPLPPKQRQSRKKRESKTKETKITI